MKKKNHDNKCNIHHRGFKGCKKQTDTHMTMNYACCPSFRNGENEKKTTMMSTTFIVVVSDVATQEKKTKTS